MMYNQVFNDLESIQHKVSSDYSSNVFLRAVFLILKVHLHTRPYKMFVSERSVTFSFFPVIVLTYRKEPRGKV